MIYTFGIISLALSLLFTIAYFLQRRKIAPIRVTVTSAVAHVRELAEAFAKFTNEKIFHQLVEVKGRVECAEPLIAPLSETLCVYYNMRVRWEYEEIYHEDKSEGGRIEHRREGEEILSEEKQWQTFRVSDATGRIAVEPAGCEVIAAETLSRHDEETGLPEEIIRCGRFAINAPWKTGEVERRPRRYHFEEEALAVGSEVYVLAEATDESGELRLQKPRSRGRFLISIKSEEELLRSARLLLSGLLAGAALCGVIGLILLART